MNDPILTKSREVKHCPPHFTRIPYYRPDAGEPVFDLKATLDEQPTTEQRIRNWLHENCDHRFYIGSYIEPYVQGVSVETKIVAFEDPADATYFSLVLPSLKN